MSDEKITPAIATKWLNKKEWAGGLEISVHKSVDALEFYHQYARNRKAWDKAFAWLKDTDLETIAPGKYKIDGDNVYASVAEAPTKNPDDAKWEAHKKYADIQYVISGVEEMGIAPISRAVAIEPFNESTDLGFYEIPEADCRYYTADSEAFFIFFPQDAHRPCIRVSGYDVNKKVVIKVLV
ncbi:MAG TPA: YhcH/YjgK/YiaL family protein [Bacteroidales bacterium]|nr:YhcH/YjgK/YiaL family protein [Bacteroidales bacterium]